MAKRKTAGPTRTKTSTLKSGKTRVYTEGMDGKYRYTGGTASPVRRKPK